MIHTPPLTRRVTRLGVAVVAITLRRECRRLPGAERTSECFGGRAPDERVGAVRAEAAAVAEDGGGPEELARRLQARGLRVTVQPATGPRSRLTRRPRSSAAGCRDVGGQDEYRTRDVALAGGLEAEVAVSTAGVRDTLQRLVLIQAATSLGGLALAALLLRGASRRAMRPVTEIAAAASRTAEGALGERLRPDDPTTELGRMATAYDTMVHALETSLAEAREAQTARCAARRGRGGLDRRHLGADPRRHDHDVEHRR